jgi:phenylacetate-CoA ligase
MERVLGIYHALPPFARQLAASAHGFQLRHWRYGPETDSLAVEARRREKWTAAQWQEWQQAKLSQVLERARVSVPYYRREWQKSNGGGLRSDQPLQNWPILSKEKIRCDPRAFIADDASGDRLRMEHTSGTTGTPLQLGHTRATARHWYALTEARWRGWYGVSRQDRWGILGGQLVAPVAQKKPPFWVWNAGLNQLYLSSYHLSAETCSNYLQILRKRRVVYLWGYASALFSLALFASEQGLEPPEFKVVISNAEPLYAHQRALIGRVFGCPVRDTYGMSEMTCAASECEVGQMHLWPEVGLHEVLHDGDNSPVACGEIGRLVCTSLLNGEMPLIRYEVGDRVAIAPIEMGCRCGRAMPILLSVEGRSDDVILTPDGRRIGRLDPVFKFEIPIREGQIVQESLDLVRIIVVPGSGFTIHHERDLITALRSRVGDMTIQLEKVEHIPRSANGKFRAVISKVKESVRA